MKDIEKYRLWNAFRREMKVLDESYRLILEGIHWSVEDTKTGGHYACSEEADIYPHRLLRWTGIKDKDGTEIFDRDIVRYAGCGQYHDLNMLVCWDSYHMGWALATEPDSSCSIKLSNSPSCYKVVGNSFQHRSLLRKDSNHGENKTLEDDVAELKQSVSYLRLVLKNHLERKDL